MLVPFFYGWKKMIFYPASFLLLLIQFCFFFEVNVFSDKSATALQEVVENPHFYNETSFTYMRWIETNPSEYSTTFHRFSDLAKEGSKSYKKILSSLAIRDAKYRRNIASIENTNNPIAVDEWQGLWDKVYQMEANLPLFQWGFKSGDFRLLDLVTYQFVHSGLFHFLMNVFFFLLLAPLAEAAMGSLLFFVFYILGGVIGGYAYATFHPNSMTPLVGASGSVSFLLGFLCIYLFRKKIYYFYWLLPKKGYYGFVKLSPIWALLMWLMTDLGAELSSTTFQNVAHSAHLGGMFFGVCVGTVFYYLNFIRGDNDFITGGETSTQSIFTD